MSLEDAGTLVATDVRFPTTAQMGAEKMYGWSINIDLFHGANHDISNSVRTFVIAAGPAFERIQHQAAENPAVGMDLVCRCMYDAQQDYFEYVGKLANGAAPACPTFSRLLSSIMTYRVGNLSTLPAPWYTMTGAPQPRRNALENRPSARSQAGAVATFNAHADDELMRRFRDSEFRTIGSMLTGHEDQIPKHGGQEVCLAWALKGQCSATCRRNRMHVRYPRGVVTKIHDLLTTCGVANAQE